MVCIISIFIIIDKVYLFQAGAEVTVTIRRSIPGSDVCNIDVPVSGSSSEEASFDCVDGGKSITFCAQFMYNSCTKPRNITSTLMRCECVHSKETPAP